MRHGQRWLSGLAVMGLAGVFMGCGKSEAPPTPAGKPMGMPGTVQTVAVAPELAPGRKVFEANGCAKCHAVGGGFAMGGGPPIPGKGPGPGGPFMGKGRGPDLGKVAADAAHTPEWLTEHIRNAKAHEPQSRMPPFEGKISAEDMQALVKYLGSLK
jgi:mono/diheme cytochrome c family protein